jgi:hypothetical protein
MFFLGFDWSLRKDFLDDLGKFGKIEERIFRDLEMLFLDFNGLGDESLIMTYQLYGFLKTSVKN